MSLNEHVRHNGVLLARERNGNGTGGIKGLVEAYEHQILDFAEGVLPRAVVLLEDKLGGLLRQHNLSVVAGELEVWAYSLGLSGACR